MIVSFYTENTGYEKHAQNLIASCEKFGLKYDIVSIPSQGSWEKNCAYKPKFLLEKLREHQKKLIWIDADAVILRKPTLFEHIDCDIALRIHENLPDDHPSKILSGTIFIKNSPATQTLLELWESECQKSDGWDQIALRNILLGGKVALKLGALPPTYCAIFDKKSALQADNVILHTQASRLLKKEINQEIVPFSQFLYNSSEKFK